MSCVQGLRAALEQAVKMVTNPVSSTISLWRYGQYGKDRLAADAAKVSQCLALFYPELAGPSSAGQHQHGLRAEGQGLPCSTCSLVEQAQSRWCPAVPQGPRS